jgi:catechol 2,3-dioxygenase-like lactoylglutathione lyase family enzyme
VPVVGTLVVVSTTRVPNVPTRVSVVATRGELLSTRVPAVAARVRTVATPVPVSTTRVRIVATRLPVNATRAGIIATRVPNAGKCALGETYCRQPGSEGPITQSVDPQHLCYAICRRFVATRPFEPSGGECDMIDHVIVTVSSFDRSKVFYEQALAPLGMTASPEFRWGPTQARGVGFGADDKEFFVVEGSTIQPPIHVAFRAPARAAVTAFHRGALAAGGRDNGAPELSPEHHADYFSAYVFDPDGHNIEAVCHEPE